MSDSAALQSLLERKFLNRSLDKLAINEPSLLDRLSIARQALSPPRGRHAQPRLAHGVLAFRVQGQRTPYPDLKYACYGVALATDWAGRRLIDDERLIDELLHAVSALRLTQPTRFHACCRALQHAWHLCLATGETNEPPRPLPNNHKIANFLLRHTQPERRRARHLAG